MVFDMMQFKMPRIRSVPLIMRPTAIPAHVLISFENLAFDRIRYPSVVFRALPVRLEEINPHFQIGSSGILSHDRPTVFRSELSYPSCPFGYIPGNITQFFPRKGSSDICSEKHQYFVPSGNFFTPNLIGEVPPVLRSE